MNEDAIRAAVVESLTTPQKLTRTRVRYKVPKDLDKRTQLAPDAPAPALDTLVASRGLEPTERALAAWDQRISGSPIIDVAHSLGVSIELAKTLINEVHAAIHEDLRANLDLNRQIDLARVDSVIKGHLPAAKAGDPEAANVVLRAITTRAKLTGVEAESSPATRLQSPQNILVWIQNQLPSINRIVDSLPIE
jgi:hypothetical protein